MPLHLSPAAVSLDVGGTSISSGLVQPDGTVLGRRHGLVDEGADAGTLVARLTDELEAHLVRLDPELEPPTVTIGFPGPFDYPAGVPLLEHKFTALHGCALGAELAAEASRRAGREIRDIRFCNDAAAAGVGEAWAIGAATGRVWVLLFGTGLGSALVSDGRFVETDAGIDTTELWRLPVAPSGPAGVPEAADDVLSARGLAAALGVAPGELATALSEPLDGETAAALEGWSDRCAGFVASVLRRCPADRLVVGGGVARSLRLFGPRLADSLSLPVGAAHGGPDVALVGAALACGVPIGRPG